MLNDIADLRAGVRHLASQVVYVTGDPGAVDDNAKVGQIGVKLGLGWAKSHTFVTGQCPVKRYNRQLMNLILNDKAHIADAVSAVAISLDGPRRSTRTSTRAPPRSTSSTPTAWSPPSRFWGCRAPRPDEAPGQGRVTRLHQRDSRAATMSTCWNFGGHSGPRRSWPRSGGATGSSSAPSGVGSAVSSIVVCSSTPSSKGKPMKYMMFVVADPTITEEPTPVT